jgi:hypothetical protein
MELILFYIVCFLWHMLLLASLIKWIDVGYQDDLMVVTRRAEAIVLIPPFCVLLAAEIIIAVLDVQPSIPRIDVGFPLLLILAACLFFVGIMLFMLVRFAVIRFFVSQHVANQLMMQGIIDQAKQSILTKIH